MGVYFFDSSAIVKRYLNERGTAWVNAITDPSANNSIYVSRITAVEVVSAIARKAQSGGLHEGDADIAISRFRYDMTGQYIIVELTRSLIDRAMELARTYVLRAYDAVQLAAALDVYAHCVTLGILTFTVVSADISLNAAASSESLLLEDPNNHP